MYPGMVMVYDGHIIDIIKKQEGSMILPCGTLQLMSAKSNSVPLILPTVFFLINTMKLKKQTNKHTESCNEWLVDNKFSAHFGKTKSILFSAKEKLKTVSDFQINCNGHVIKSHSSGKYLSIDQFFTEFLRDKFRVFMGKYNCTVICI
jgi:hypothetical protein